MTPDQEVLRGGLAADVLGNSVYQEAYETIDKALVKAWRDSRVAADREDLHKMIGLLGRVQAHMQAAMQNGQITEKEILRKRNFAERMGLARS
jgi:CRISPR/Cas system endoribonuclease Cas6 (RAMP superfamily)